MHLHLFTELFRIDFSPLVAIMCGPGVWSTEWKIRWVWLFPPSIYVTSRYASIFLIKAVLSFTKATAAQTISVRRARSFCENDMQAFKISQNKSTHENTDLLDEGSSLLATLPGF